MPDDVTREFGPRHPMTPPPASWDAASIIHGLREELARKDEEIREMAVAVQKALADRDAALTALGNMKRDLQQAQEYIREQLAPPETGETANPDAGKLFDVELALSKSTKLPRHFVARGLVGHSDDGYFVFTVVPDDAPEYVLMVNDRLVQYVTVEDVAEIVHQVLGEEATT